MELEAGQWNQPAAQDLLQAEPESQSRGESPPILDESESLPGHVSDSSNTRYSETRNCTHCADVRAAITEHYQLSWQDCQGLFHSACPCDETAPQVPDDQGVCAFCRHLRLRHLFLCPSEDPSDLDYYPALRLPDWNLISLGRTREVVERAVQRSSCPSCRFWAGLATHLMPEYSDRPFVVGVKAWGFLAATVFLDDDYCKETEIDVNIQSLSPLVGGRTSPLQENHGNPRPRRIDWERTANWLHECCRDHEKCGPKDARSLPTNFRVIDVQERKLVLPTLPCRYVALSYVWGSGLDPRKLMAMRSTIKSLEEPGSLHPSVLPQTIVDAMTVCERLSERYLWADCLCIVQDDPEDKRDQIGRMASIYSAAEMALIIASGSSMDQPVPGVSVDRPERMQATFLGLHLTESISELPWRLLKSSIWSTRGWTYQEGILPSRKLYVMDQETWFECGEAVIREDIHADQEQEKYVKKGSKLARAPVSNWLGGVHHPEADESEGQPPWNSYYWHLSEYSTRTLGNDGDIFNAFMGIMHPLFDDHGGTTFGLPIASFGEALLWGNLDCTDGSAPSMRPGVPTWSWGSMRGRTDADGQDAIGTLVRWSQYSELEQEFVEMSNRKDQWPDEPKLGFIENATCLALAWANGLLEKPCPQELDHRSVTFDALSQVATSRWPSPCEFMDEALEKVQLDDYNTLDVRKAGILCGRVQTAVLKIMRGDPEYCEHLRRSFGYRGREDVIILDHHGDRIGFLAYLHDPKLDSRINPGILGAGTDCEFLALSVSTHALPEGLLKDERTQHESATEEESRLAEKKREWSFFDCNGRESYPHPIVNVMLVWTDEEGYSYRIGIGWVMMTKWAGAKPTFRNVALR